MSATPTSEERGSARLEPSGGLAQYAGALRGFPRNVKLFLTITAFRGLTIAALQTVLNLYLYSLGYDARFIGLINGVNSLATLLFSVPLGVLADRVGRRRVLTVGGVLYPAIILGIGLSSSTPTLLLFNFLFGAVASAYWVTGVPLLYASTTNRQRVQAFSVNSFLLWGLGPFASLLSGQVVEVAARVSHVSASSSGALRSGVLFMALLGTLGAVPYLFLREATGRARSGTPSPPPRGMVGLFARLLAPDLALAFGMGAVTTFSQLYFHLRFGLDPGAVGIVMACAGVVAGAGTLCTPLVAHRWGNLGTAVRLQWLIVPAMIVLALAGYLVLAVPMYCIMITLRGMSDPVYTAFIQERVPDQYRARLTGLYSVTYAIGSSLGPLASGQLQQAGGFTPAFLLGAMVYLGGASLLYLLFGRPVYRR